jgi:hypothetical protein
MGNGKEIGAIGAIGMDLRDWFHPSRRKAREINAANQ